MTEAVTPCYGATRRIPLHQLAHARAGDKGNTSSISVWALDPGDYPLIKQQLTADRIKSVYGRLIAGEVVRYELDQLHGLNFVLREALEGGVNTSLNLDSHGKSWSYLILDLDIEVPDNSGNIDRDGHPDSRHHDRPRDAAPEERR